MTSSLPPSVASTNAPAPLTRRIRDTFLAPTSLAQHLRISTPWIDVLLISLAVAVLSVLVLPDQIFIEPMQDAVSRRGVPVEITSPPEVIARWGKWIEMLQTLATHPVIIFCLAGFLTLVFSIVSRGRGSFNEYLSLAAHAALIPAFGSVAVFIVRLLTGAVVDRNLLGALTALDSQGGFWVSAASILDPFIIWMLVVLGAGAHVFDPRHSRLGSTALLFSCYLVIVLLSTALIHPVFR